jgi:hypothetical protein
LLGNQPATIDAASVRRSVTTRRKPGSKTLKIVLSAVAIFLGLAGTISFLSVTGRITPEAALLMFIALVGLYFGFGFLIAVYRLVAKLE